MEEIINNPEKGHKARLTSGICISVISIAIVTFILVCIYYNCA